MGSAIKTICSVVSVGSALAGHGALAGERKDALTIAPGRGLMLDVG